LALQRRLSDVVAEYDQKRVALDQALVDFNTAGEALKMAATIGGTYGDTNIETGHVYERELSTSLLRSAWKHVYAGLNIAVLASPKDKRRFEQSLTDPAPFTIDNIRASFGTYILDPRAAILRSMAEVFCDLDPFYRSHEKMKVGVKGLPKRVILNYMGDYSSHGREKVEAIINAMAAFEGKPLVTWREISALLKDERALVEDGDLPADRTWDEPVKVIGRGIRLRRFGNGNGHLFFEPAALRTINLALSEYYGEILPDCADDAPDAPRASTAVAKDLQYYPTPAKVAADVVTEAYVKKGDLALDPSCGCGRLLDAARAAGAKVVGIEVDPLRAAEAMRKGHRVMVANFLDTVPTPTYDVVLMNPPFYGKHYVKHVEHALKFLKSGGRLIAILPSTARYDHGLVDGSWRDLPVGSFSESGTNVNTSVLTIHNRER
jgi:predicted RNA methylase